jgi:hypothetical protein
MVQSRKNRSEAVGSRDKKMRSSTTNHWGQIDYERELDESRRLVGQALLSFGDIEAFTLRCLDRIPSDKVAKTSSSLSFARRVDLLVEIIEGRCMAPSPAAELASKLKATKTLTEVRNVIAHNPLQLEVCARSANDATAERSMISAKSQGKLIDLACLKEYVAKVENAVSELHLALGPALDQFNLGEAREQKPPL